MYTVLVSNLYWDLNIIDNSVKLILDLIQSVTKDIPLRQQLNVFQIVFSFNVFQQLWGLMPLTQSPHKPNELNLFLILYQNI